MAISLYRFSLRPVTQVMLVNHAMPTNTPVVAGGIHPETALQMISQARGVKVPDTDEQEAWLLKLPDYLKV